MDYRPSIQHAALLIPATGKHPVIAPGSAIVSRGLQDEHWTAYYEGGIYDRSLNFETKLAIAAGRLADKAPTIALLSAPKAEFIHAADLVWDEDYHCWSISTIHQHDDLLDWLELDNLQLGPSDDQRQRRASIILSRFPRSMVDFEIARRAGRDPYAAIVAKYG